MSAVVVRALKQELRRADEGLRIAFAEVGSLCAYRSGENRVAHDAPRGQVTRALRLIQEAVKNWDEVNAELERAKQAVSEGATMNADHTKQS